VAALFFAATRIGVAAVALSPRYRDAEIAFMLADSEAKAVFTMSRIDGFEFLPMLDRIASTLPALRHVIPIDSDVFVGMASGPVDNAALTAVTRTVQPADLAMVIYTSGTTGRSKGCALTNASLLGSVGGQFRHTCTRPGDLVQLANPFNHVGGITCGILSQLLAGGSCELVPVFKAKTVLDMIRRRPPAIIIVSRSHMTWIGSPARRPPPAKLTASRRTSTRWPSMSNNPSPRSCPRVVMVRVCASLRSTVGTDGGMGFALSSRILRTAERPVLR